MLIGLGDFAHNAARHADSDDVSGNGLFNDTTCADDAVIADGCARQNRSTCANPHVIADGYRLSILHTFHTLLGVDGVLGGGEGTIWRDKNVVAEGYFCPVVYDEIMVGIKVAADVDIIAVVAPKRRGHGDAFARIADDFLKFFFAAVPYPSA